MSSKKSTILFILCLFSLNSSMFCQCIASATLRGTVSSSETSIGSVSWNNPANAEANDNNTSTASALILGDESNYLLIQDFGFSIPNYAIICGISVAIEKKGTGILQNIEDFSIRLFSGGVFVGDDKAGAGNWPASSIIQTHGANNDTWSTALTPADVNSATFGVGVAVTLNGSIALPIAEVDVVEITLFYDPTLPIELIHFNAISENNRRVTLNWSTASELNNDYFLIEESTDAFIWKEIHQLEGIHNSNSKTDYQVSIERSDLAQKYYRLSQVDFDGTRTFLEIAYVDELRMEEPFAFPNPSAGQFELTSEEAIIEVKIFNIEGQLIQIHLFDNITYRADLRVEKPGLYLVQSTNTNNQTTRLKVLVK